ncbi:microcystin LR degradation protein MlrC-like protein [Bradyrhizobium sp. CCBAU 45394]|uniref:M81 family metallopeptidase n=1 Tax=Bradyrhizobium sp. CCBAU 45394 TaxID=1325087 RepID=UPI002302C75E|nr:M81 family metallopeptidase [Bradyrhizobium sp. CCBAU 45394]MDA9391525.1 microcystin LR degradation protein MlrC-like protein [Bradyrhizobium sp. CCBAU 45394]
MRLFAASLATETNPTSPLPTSLDSFKDCVFLRPGEHPEEAPLFGTEPLWVARRRAATEGFTLVEGSCFAATPAGTTNRRDYEFMRDEILAQLKAALPVDGVLLGLHGAMVAHGYDDVEGDILEHVRALVGPKCVIGVELDPHCHLTVKRVKLADVIVLYKEYPHTDTVERAEELVDIVLKALRGKVNPVMSLYDCRQIQLYLTTLPLMRGFVDRIKAMEGKDGVLSISVCHCFPWADVPELSGRILVVMDKNKTKGDALATMLGEEFVSMRAAIEAQYEYLSVDEAIDAALEFDGAPVLLAETADAAGAGAPSDNTTILRRLIERRIENAAVAAIWDPVAVRLCIEAGKGSEFPLRIGGKTGPMSGVPIDATASVIGLKRDNPQCYGSRSGTLGNCAAVRVGGVEVVLVSKRASTVTPELFRAVGIDPLAKKILVSKSARPLITDGASIARKMIYVDSGALQSVDYRRIPYRRVNRPIWPLDDDARPGLIF